MTTGRGNRPAYLASLTGILAPILLPKTFYPFWTAFGQGLKFMKTQFIG
jgi:hypothetical protein